MRIDTHASSHHQKMLVPPQSGAAGVAGAGPQRSELPAFEVAVKVAIVASVGVPAAERIAFIGHHLLAQHEGSVPPSTSTLPNASTLAPDEVRHLSTLLTRALNSTRGRHGWPLRAVAESLIAQHSKIARLPRWWHSAAQGSGAPLPLHRSHEHGAPEGVPYSCALGSAGPSTGLPFWWSGELPSRDTKSNGGHMPEAAASRITSTVAPGGGLPFWWPGAKSIFGTLPKTAPAAITGTGRGLPTIT